VPAKRQRRSAPGLPRPERGQRVLAVDSDAAFLTAVKRVVESGRCRVDCAATAAEAAAFLQRNRYNLVIADLQMPGLEPAELFARLEDDLSEGMRLLFLAAEPPPAALQAFLDERRLACLVKPLHLRRFLDKLDDLLLLETQPPDEEEE
jgi:CheY-like chemotaxis protein